MGGPIGSSLAGGLNGGGCGSISSGSRYNSSHVSQSIWSHCSFHNGIGWVLPLLSPQLLVAAAAAMELLAPSTVEPLQSSGTVKVTERVKQVAIQTPIDLSTSPIYSPTNNTSSFAGFSSSGNRYFTGTSSDVTLQLL